MRANQHSNTSSNGVEQAEVTPTFARPHPIPRLATPELPPVTPSNKTTLSMNGIPTPINVDGLKNEVDQIEETLRQSPAFLNEQQASPAISAPRNRISPAELLADLLTREQALSEAATKAVVFSPPLINRHEAGIIGRGTVNIIQGAYGSHKSRLAETFGALMLNTDTDARFLEFSRPALERFAVCYIDTERNQSEELPYAVQQIKLKAGFNLSDRPADFRFTSIKAIDRKHRFTAIDAFISHVRESTTLHLFTLIDVVTDAIGDFNDSEETMKLFDFLGNMCDRHNATFLLVIHQNPGTDKARGHTGTEAANKASSVLQIGFEKDANGNESDLIRLRYLKLRRGKRPEPIYIRYCDQTKGLVLADAAQVAEHVNHRKHKAHADDMAERLTSLLSEGPVAKGEVVSTLMIEFSAGNRIIRERLKSIQEQGADMYNEEGQAVRLIGYKDGKQEYYRLEPIS
ncbi:MAG: hypothetical protein JWP57_3707 [Spirosoma sp.]|nr:hypothetical protein [Spirosoma sp.]